ncbi:tRNA endonuclease ANKZF1 [Microcaecilia unicolor]|uniref:Ankyrin repeat and zinc finger domain-containing protein 1 n=1 Tax=Microcaecilia unicolor TaxID=1415580 RepID=A0A6P7YEL5_9AMPH|nr:ankyrin repeat and zinc finger domain-containing protein 1 [Microcaecilia unicolor]
MQLETWSVFEAGQDSCLLDGLSVVNVSTRRIVPEKPSNIYTEQTKQVDKESVEMIPEISDRMCCSTCQCVFENREEQIEHYKLDWHRFNLKQRLMGKVTVSVQEFEDRTCAGDVSSISGSDWEDSSEETETDQLPAGGSLASESAREEGNRTGSQSHRVLFQNAEGQFLSVYRCVLSTQKVAEMEPSDLVESLKSLHVNSCWVILMAGGGHFAGAVFNGNEAVKHKTFHRYTIRAKRGTSQGLHDRQNRGSMPRSAGASLRRYNEVALVKDIHAVLESWAQEMQEAHAIFLRAPSHNRAIFYGTKNSLLQKNDPRVHNIPIATRRATFKEVKRVHVALAALQVYGKDTDTTDIGSPKKVWKKMKNITLKEPCRAETHGCPGKLKEEDEMEEEELVPAEELIMEEESLETLHLKEFEVFPIRKRKKKKRKDGKKSNEEPLDCPGVPQTHLLQFSAGATPTKEALKSPGCQEQKGRAHFRIATGEGTLTYQLRNELFTFCKTGATVSLQHLLRPLLLGAAESEERLSADAEPVHTAGKTADECELLRPDSGSMHMQTHAHDALREQQESQRLEEVEQRNVCTLSEEVSVIHSLINERIDGTGFTLLHLAAAIGQSSIVRVLLDAGWDPAVRDDAGQTPYLVSADKRTRNVFRKYQADNPGKFDYSTAQIPEPLTAEIEAKKLEKRRAQKAQRRQREKEEKERRKQEEEETAEKIRFAALSDREKRALAAERRFAEQLSSEGTPVANIERCWTCGGSLLGRIPFQYFDFSFCSTACLQQHKRSRAAKS